MKSMHFTEEMKASLTELRRETGRLLGTVIHGKKNIELTEHGKVVAEIQPSPQPMSGKQFAAAWSNRKALGKETAEAIATFVGMAGDEGWKALRRFAANAGRIDIVVRPDYCQRPATHTQPPPRRSQCPSTQTDAGRGRTTQLPGTQR